jgi:cation:H+ antiporter
MLTGLLLLALGLLGLWGGTLLAVRGAVQLSERFGLSEAFIGLTVLAIGTDLPEMVVAIGGSLRQLQGVEASGVIVGTSLGSAMAQGTLVLGVTGMRGYLPVAPRLIRRVGTTLLLAIALTGALALDGRIARLEGLALLLAYAMYFVALVQGERLSVHAPEPRPAGRLPGPLAIALGLVMISLGAHIVVTEGIALADRLRMSQTLLGIVFVGAGTSLPELALSLGAATQQRASMAVGNVIGSNVFDLLVPIGLGGLIHPLTVESRTVALDFPALFLAMLVLVVFLLRRRGLQRREAAVLVATYVVYVAVRTTIG